MKLGNIQISKRTLALLTITALLFAGGSFAGTRAALTYFSEDYTAAFELDHLQVHLLENDKDVCGGNNKMDTVHRSDDATAQPKSEKYKGNLLEYLGYTNDTHYGDAAVYTIGGTPGKVSPGRVYKEKISAENGSNIDQYVRLTVRKYWVKDGVKVTSLNPEQIRLVYGKDDTSKKAADQYNKSAWTRNPEESTAESETYYLKKMLPGGAKSEALFDSLSIDASIADKSHMKEDTSQSEDGVTVVTYTYDYDDYTFYIEADVQAIQTHNVNDAIKSLWGVSNVSASNGTVTVK